MKYSTLLAITSLIAPSFAQNARVHTVGLLPGGSTSSMQGVSADGSVVVGNATDAFDQVIVRWTAEGGLESYPSPYDPDLTVSASAVSSDGQTIVGHVLESEWSFGFSWSEAQGWTGLDVPTEFVFVYDASADGQTLVGRGNNQTFSGPDGPFRWTPTGGHEFLGALGNPPTWGTAAAVSDDGEVIVGTSSSQAGHEAFRWTETSGMVGLGVLPSHPEGSHALAISADGTIIVGSSGGSSSSVPFMWTEQSGMVALDTLPGFDTHTPRGVSADGELVIGRAGPWPNEQDFVWTPTTGTVSLVDFLSANGAGCLDGWESFGAYAVSDDGNTLVGAAYSPELGTQGWVAYLDGSVQPVVGARYCDPAVANSTGEPAELTVAGSTCVMDDDLQLAASNLPAGEYGVFFAGTDMDVSTPIGSQGDLCVSGQAVRFDLFLADGAGTASLALSLPLTPVVAGSAWNFQSWHRDRNPAPTSNLTNAVSVTFR